MNPEGKLMISACCPHLALYILFEERLRVSNNDVRRLAVPGTTATFVSMSRGYGLHWWSPLTEHKQMVGQWPSLLGAHQPSTFSSLHITYWLWTLFQFNANTPQMFQIAGRSSNCLLITPYRLLMIWEVGWWKGGGRGLCRYGHRPNYRSTFSLCPSGSTRTTCCRPIGELRHSWRRQQ